MISCNSRPVASAIVNVDEVDTVGMNDGEGLRSRMWVGAPETRSVAKLNTKTHVGKSFGLKVIL